MDGEQETNEQETDQSDASDNASEKEGQDYLDRSKLDFDPDDGLYTGTAVEGTSEIPGPHEEEADDEQEQQDDADQ